MKNRFRNLRRLLIIIRANIRLKYAARLAERLHARHGERFYVMPDPRDRLVVMRRNGMRKLRRRGYMDARVVMKDVVKECFYLTADRSGTPPAPHVLEAKRRMYLDYATRRL